MSEYRPVEITRVHGESYAKGKKYQAIQVDVEGRGPVELVGFPDKIGLVREGVKVIAKYSEGKGDRAANYFFTNVSDEDGGRNTQSPPPPRATPPPHNFAIGEKNLQIKSGRAVNTATLLFVNKHVDTLEAGLREAIRIEVLADQWYEKVYAEELNKLKGKDKQPLPQEPPPPPKPVEPPPDEDDIPF